MDNLKEYVITLKNYDDLNEFYQDMETPGGNMFIPDRAVEVSKRRESSRNTHYLLSPSEVEQITQDPRVLSIELMPDDLGLVVRPTVIQTESDWDKSATNSSGHNNWGLLRIVEGEQRANWGSDGTTAQTGTININSTGRNVDIVIVDGHINPDHPEFAVNADGSGGTRIVQYNWFQHTSTVTGSANGTYVYTPYVDANNVFRTNDNNHGAHVAGTAAGNTQGWARSAMVYNINPYSTNTNSLGALYIFDYVRQFHANKPVNAETGKKNPTIVNNSWGYFYEIPIAQITSIVYRGATVAANAAVTSATLTQYGIPNDETTTLVPARYYALDADLEDAISDGIMVVGAAGNNSVLIDVPNGVDYNNYFVFNNGTGIYGIFYHEGSSPGSSPGAICVGAVSSLVNEQKASYSNCGPRVDIYAPGSFIMSSINSTDSGVVYPTNSGYRIQKYSGTSMASPQVAGVLACAMESYPYMTQAKAMAYLTTNSKTNQITNSAGGLTDYSSLQGSSNRYLFYRRERPLVGAAWPKLNFLERPAQGLMYPRASVKI